MVGFLEGWRGVVENNTMPLTIDTISGILPRGGTILRTSRTNPAKKEGHLERCVKTLRDNEIGALIFPNIEACRALAAGPAADVTSDTRVREELRARLAAFANTSTGSSNRVCRAILLAEPPSLDAGEMTDKGSINQRAVLERRAALVDELYRQPLSPRVIATEEQA